MRREDRLLHRFPFSLADLGELGLKLASSPFFLLSISLVRPRRRLSPAPTAECRVGRAQMLSRLPRFRATHRCGASLRDDGLGLDSVEHDGTLVMSGP